MSDPHRHPVLAGALSGGAETLLSYPFDYVKTQLQLSSQATTAASTQPRYRGMMDVCRATWLRYGVAGFYRGLSTNLVFAFPRTAVRFSVYELARKQMMHDDGSDLSAGERAVAGLCSGVVEALTCVVPMTTLQVKLIQDLNREVPRYRGFVHGVSTIAREEGAAGLYRGLGPTLLKISLNQSMRFAAYGEIRAALDRVAPSQGSSAWASGVSLVAGAAAGMVSVVVNHPVDVIKSNMQGLHAARYRGALDCMRQIAAEDGWVGLYKGLVPRLARVGVEVGLSFAFYELASALCNTLLDGEPFRLRDASGRSA